MIARRDELLALGALDRRLATLPARFERLLADVGAMQLDREDNLTSAEYARLRAMGAQVAEMCERLASFGIPETLQHDDFHDANIFFGGGRYLFFDWGESAVAHPFFTLTVTLRSVAYSMELDEGGPEIARLREVYLEPWERYAPRDRLRTAFPLARRLGMFNRALTWHHVVSSLADGPDKEAQADAVPGWMQEFLLATP
jgi:aminoglycoside phosphotransferase (APT) family kinase protein